MHDARIIMKMPTKNINNEVLKQAQLKEKCMANFILYDQTYRTLERQVINITGSCLQCNRLVVAAIMVEAALEKTLQCVSSHQVVLEIERAAKSRRILPIRTRSIIRAVLCCRSHFRWT